MKKIILLVLVVSLVAPAFLIITNTSALACGEKAPETLLALYRNSKSIHVATYRGQDNGEVKKADGDSPGYFDYQRNFDVSSTLKGESTKFVAIPDREYIYDEPVSGFESVEELEKAHGTAEAPSPAAGAGEESAATESDDVGEGGDEEEGLPQLKAGDHVLLFLRTNDESKDIELTDYRDGLKKLTHSEIAVYEARLKEIGPILAAKKPNPEKIVDWLIRLAEDPVTRWEGTYELEQSFYAVERKAALEAERKTAAAGTEDAESDELASYSEASLDTGTATMFANNLGAHHKQTLSNLLLDSKFRRAQKTPDKQPARGDHELMSLVARWGDGRIAGLFLDQIRSAALSPYDNSTLMAHVAVILDDKGLSEIAGKLSENTYQDDDAEVEDEARPVAADDTAGGVDMPSNSAVRLPSSKTAKKKALTYKVLRATLIAQFLGRADAIIERQEARAAR
ncbi:MAG: hypothetical protein WKF34_01880 [Pyrinomonadaceae bacterium]